MKLALENLEKNMEGALHIDALYRSMYATDASVYLKTPLAVAFPENQTDLKKLLAFARENEIGLIPRTAGTSLAGQCVGDGIVVDTSKHFNRILSFDKTKKTVRIEPGVIRDDLNRFTRHEGLFLGPNTSTSNRCMIGGMVGNNSSGTTSIRYGVTRDKILELKAVLSDGSSVLFREITSEAFLKKTKENTLEGTIYKTVFQQLSQPKIQEEIHKEFPKKRIHRRNTGYAVDCLLESDLFGGKSKTINMAKFLCGSEGTLAFTTEILMQLDHLPPSSAVMVGVHFDSVQESLEAVPVAMQHELYNCELMDKIILDCTKNNREQEKNRFFLKGDPEAILMLEVAADSAKKAEEKANALIADLKKHQFGFHHPKILGKDIPKIHNLRKAGLGLLGNIVGDRKAVACIEDTAVELKDLPHYIADFTKMMERYKQKAVYYAHAGAGEIHLRPILNLKKKEDVALFRKITYETAKLVKSYQGSFSGEHGDGIVRSEFIPVMIGAKNYELLKKLKSAFDPQGIMNPGKIIAALPMQENLRYHPDRKEPEISTQMDFSDSGGILRVAEKCNGSGDCRKSVEAGGAMCPSYRATKDEKDTTRARANVLRDFLTQSSQKNKFNHPELKEVFDLCLSCKACASECPSNVDVANLKAEFLHQYYKSNKRPFRSIVFGMNAKINSYASKFPMWSNFISSRRLTKKILGIALERSLPTLQKTTLRSWYKKNKSRLHQGTKKHGKVYLFCDEFTNFYDVPVGIDALEFLSFVGFQPMLVAHLESGRSAISKGMLTHAQNMANQNINIFKDLLSEETPLVGIEPSAILTFRDEYLRLASDKKEARRIAKHCHTLEEFLNRLSKEGSLTPALFTKKKKTIKIHGHCHQKSLSSTHAIFEILNLPENYSVSILNTGCCGMAGSFGYEKEHYKLSMQIGEHSLFPKIRNCTKDTVLAVPGTSCRHQITAGTERDSLHPISILWQALHQEMLKHE
jgi:FAD/FMN-containing dehydrogenase/Fe-S oxidoreductase